MTNINLDDIRRRMINHDVENDTAIVKFTAKEVEQILTRLVSAEQELEQCKKHISHLYKWLIGGPCSDCEMFREAPSYIEFQHAHDCSFLKDINKALSSIGRQEIPGHHYIDPQAEMLRFAQERCAKFHKDQDGGK